MQTTAPTPNARPVQPLRSLAAPAPRPATGLTLAILALAAVASLSGFFGGPGLGDHEALVAQAARNMRTSGDWILPMFLGEPWFRKPPLPYWLVGLASYLFPNDSNTGLPVTAAAARLPSALAGFGTILLLWKLASAMFGPRTGRVTTVIASSTILFLLYSPNATAEMPLTFCCVWAYLHFWYVATLREPRRRLMHVVLFYIALGMGMLAKGPAPVAMVGLPLAIWWYTNRPLRILARRGPRALKQFVASFIRGFWPRTVESFTRLWLIPGLLFFALFFVPWMFAAAWRVAEFHGLHQLKDSPAWAEWNWQYVMRAQGDYLDSRDHGPFYYLLYIVGFIMPWFFLLPEGLLSPWLKRYARIHRPLLYAVVWAIVAIAVMSAESFKKPYYIIPAMPGLILLMGVIAERFYSSPVRKQKRVWIALAAVAVAFAIAVVIGAFMLRHSFPQVAGRLTIIMAATALAVLAAGSIHIRGRPWIAFAALALTTLAAFQSIWHSSGQLLDDLDRAEAMAKVLAPLPQDARILWADGRPDSRLDFYFGRRTGYMIHPSEIVGAIQDRKRDKTDLMLMCLSRAQKLMRGPDPVYLIFERGSFEMAQRNELKAHEIGSVSRKDPTAESPAGKSKKDWVVVTNRP